MASSTPSNSNTPSTSTTATTSRPAITIIPSHAKLDPRPRWWCNRCLCSTTAKRDLTRHYKLTHSMLLDAMGKVDAGEEGRWREETYKERLARETGAKKGNMKASHAEVEVVEISEDDEDDEGEDEDEIEKEDGDDESDDAEEDEDEEDDDAEERDEKEDEDVVMEDGDEATAEALASTSTPPSPTLSDQGPTHPEYTSVQLFLRAANRRYAAECSRRDGDRVWAAIWAEEAEEYENEAWLVEELERKGERVPWDFGPAWDQKRDGGPGTCVKEEFGA